MKKYTKIATAFQNIIEIKNHRGRLRKFKSQYDPNNLLNALIKHLALKNDAALAKMLDISSLVISKIRQLTQPVSGTILILMHEKTGFSFSELRRFMGDRRQKFRIKGAQLICQ